jgi:pimeloyl-ACP methyl ester carboxylesterase
MRQYVVLLALVAVAATLGLGRTAVAADAPQVGACTGLPNLERAQCGTIRVPLDRTNPRLGTTQVAFAFLPRTDTSRPSLGTLVPNPGGPGVGVISSSESRYTTSLAPLLDRRDLLLVDPRGTGRSDAIACTTLSGTAPAFATGEQMLARIGACGRELGARVGAYGTAAVADDIEAVRAALGLERLDLWGDSYGTYLMPVYAARHPEHVQSMVLSGAGPIAFDPWRRDHLGAAVRGIRVVCARTRSCSGDAVLRDIARLAARLRERPVPFTFSIGGDRVRGRVDEGVLAEIVFTSGTSAAFGRIPGAVASALAGDFASLQRMAANQTLALAGIFSDPSFSAAHNFAVNCHDYPRVFSYADTPVARRAAYERALDAVDPRDFWPFSPDGWVNGGQASAGCLDWPSDATAGSPLPAGARFPNVPVLVLSGELDANSPSAEGRKAAAQFARATFVEIPNAGHTPAAQSACALNLALRFVATHQANANACARTGTPPRVSPPAPRRAAELPLIPVKGTVAERRALGLVVVTAGDLIEQAGILELTGEAGGLRGGRYVTQRSGTIRLVGVRVVRDASVSGVLGESRDGGIVGTMRIRGSGVLNGQVRVRLSEAGRSRVTGTLDGRRVDFAFRL